MPPPRGPHIGQFGLAFRHFVDDGAGIRFIDIDDDFFDRLQPLAIYGLEQNARAADGKLEAFAAHGFDQDAELQFAAARDFKGVLVFGFRNADRDIAFDFAHQTVADDAAGDLVAFGAGQRRVVDRESHRNRRRIDRARDDRRGYGEIAQRIGNRCLAEARR